MEDYLTIFFSLNISSRKVKIKLHAENQLMQACGGVGGVADTNYLDISTALLGLALIKLQVGVELDQFLKL